MEREDPVKEMYEDGCRPLGNTVEVPREDIRVYGMVRIDIADEELVNGDPYGAIETLVKIPKDVEQLDNTVEVSKQAGEKHGGITVEEFPKINKEDGSCVGSTRHYGSSETRNFNGQQLSA